jgi:hypothetical protein
LSSTTSLLHEKGGQSSSCSSIVSFLGRNWA